MESLKSPLNSAQLELLKMFSTNIPETNWLQIKKLFVRYLAKKAVSSANEVWDKKGWTAEDDKKMLETHMRTPYK